MAIVRRRRSTTAGVSCYRRSAARVLTTIS